MHRTSAITSASSCNCHCARNSRPLLNPRQQPTLAGCRCTQSAITSSSFRHQIKAKLIFRK